ncbi:hypothetical protein NL676_007707 [Syzygium grande]|nr:hypothetical protein NL676_007707 [Syzygium grande]
MEPEKSNLRFDPSRSSPSMAIISTLRRKRRSSLRQSLGLVPSSSSRPPPLRGGVHREDPFPLKAICGSVWKNIEGQISFLKYSVSAPPEAFTFAHSSRQLAYVDAINGHKLQLGHANHAWLCLDLLDVLCQIAEAGYAGSVRAMLEYPLKYCPEVLLLAMAHINACNWKCIDTFHRLS